MSFLKKLTGVFGSESTKQTGTPSPKAALSLEPLSYKMNAAGRVPLLVLEDAAAQLSKEAFCDYVGVPALVGSGIHEGHVTSRAFDAGNRKKTMVFIPTEALEEADEARNQETLQRAIYPLFPNLKKSQPETANALSIGRDSECDISMPDTAISEHQARIYIAGSDYSLHDTRSTNGTWVNGERLGSEPVALNDGYKIRFARYEFTFVSPATLYTLLSATEKK
jgi:hypothetical protein